MATWRKRGDAYEFKVTRRKVLPRPVYYTFDSVEEGLSYCDKLEALLDKGIVPEGLVGDAIPRKVRSTVGKLVKDYMDAVSISMSDRKVLETQLEKPVSSDKLSAIDHRWAEGWVAQMKQVDRLAPGTIRHHVGALARCLDWAMRRGDLIGNPLRSLPRGYSSYSERDARQAGCRREDISRDRRLEEGEEDKIRQVISGSPAMALMFDFALETAMRMREIYTLGRSQVNLTKRTIFLEKTKNGDKRQVPLSSVALDSTRGYLKKVPEPERGPGDLLFPFWDGVPKQDSLRRATVRLSIRWRRAFVKAGCGGLHFHDLRHEATCRLYERTSLTDIQIALITGHRDPRMLRRYANLRASDLAGKLW